MIYTHNQLVANAFNASSFTYDEHARMQTETGQSLIQKITKIKNDFHHVLDAGCGTGVTTESLARAIHFQSLHAVDIADRALPKGPSFDKRIHFNNLDFNSINLLPQKFDLIFSNMALHWSHSLSDTLNNFRSAITHNGMLAFTIPLHGTFTEIKEHFSIHHFFNQQQVIDMLCTSSFHLIHQSEQIYHETFLNAITALRSLKLTGVHHVDQPRKASLRGKEFINSLSFNSLSYVNGFFIAEARS